MTTERTGVLGQPRGVVYLIFVEGWTNFAIYGVRVLLLLYMTRALLLPGHAGQVMGLAPLRDVFAHGYGALSTVALASAIAGLFSSLNYLTPLAGALIADRWFGRTRTILVGGALMIAGILLLLSEACFLVALLCILLGGGLFSGNLTAQLGELYARDDPRRGDGFQLYYLAVDAGVIVSPLVCGTMGEEWGFGWGFGVAALGMVIALAGYLAGLRWMPAAAPRRIPGVRPRASIGRRGWQAVLVLALLIPVIAMAGVANNQIYGAYELWGDANYDLVFFGRHLPVSWLLSMDAFISFGCGFVVLGMWRWLEARGRLPSEIDRCAIGTLLSAAATLLLAVASWAAHGHKLGLGWGIAFHTVNNLGVAMLFPLTLALFSRAAPAGLAATMINSSKLSFFVSFQVVGWLGGLVDRIDGARFWGLHALIVAAAGAVLLVFGRLFNDLLAPLAESA